MKALGHLPRWHLIDFRRRKSDLAWTERSEVKTPPERSGGLGLKAAGALATNHIKRATRAKLAWPEQRVGNPTPSAILRLRAGSFEWQAIKKAN